MIDRFTYQPEDNSVVNHLNIGSNTNVFVNRLLITQSGTYNDMVLRPFNAEHAGNGMESLLNRCSEVGVTNLSGNHITDIASQIIVPTASHLGVAIAPYGWGQRRNKFFMEVIARNEIGVDRFYHITGYTEHNEGFGSFGVDPDLCFYINNITEGTRQIYSTPNGRTQTDRYGKDRQYLFDPLSNGNSLGHLISMRPYDVMNNIQKSGLNLGMSGFEFENINEPIIDNRTLIGNEVRTVDRSQTLSSNYVADFIQRTSISKVNNDVLGQSEYDSVSNCIKQVREELATDNLFVARLKTVTGMPFNNYFTWSQLRQLDPNVDRDEVTVFINMSHSALSQLPSVGQSANWNSCDRSTQVATILAQTVPSIMTVYGLSDVSFSSTNNTLGSQIFTTITGAKFNSPCNVEVFSNAFITRVNEEIINIITFGNQIPYRLHMTVSKIGDTIINISIDNDNEMVYVAPTFMDSAFSPLITNNVNQFVLFADDMSNILQRTYETLPSAYEYQCVANSTKFGNDDINYYPKHSQPTLNIGININRNI